MTDYVNIALVGIALAFGLTRVGIVFVPGLIPKGHALEAYKAFAHIFVGGLFGAWAINMDAYRDDLPWKCFWIGVSLSAVELASFLVDKFVLKRK